MRKITLLLLVIATASLTGAVAKGKKCEAQKAKYVVLIGSDGFSSDVVRAHSGAFPNIEALMKNGSYTLERRSVLPSSSAVNWASMLMGAGPELHGYTTWGSQVPDLPSRVIGKYGLFPGICGAIRDARPDAVMACGYNWPTIGCLYEQKAVNINSNVPSDPALADSMCLYIGREKPLFTFIAFGEPDETGHRCGWESDEYFEMCKQIAGYVGKIMETLEKNGMKDDAIVFFTADHGGTGKGHGGISMKEMETPFVVCGKGIKQGHEIPESVMVFDCAPTIGHIFSIDQPQVWIGRPDMSVFE